MGGIVVLWLVHAAAKTSREAHRRLKSAKADCCAVIERSCGYSGMQPFTFAVS